MNSEFQFDNKDEKIVNWAASLLDGAFTVDLQPPHNEMPHTAIYLLDVIDNPPLRTSGRPPLQVYLHYLVSVWDDDMKKAHRALGQLLTMAMQEFEVDLTPIPASLWQALHAIPRPAFIIKLPATVVLPEPDIPLAREHIVRTEPLVTLYGRITASIAQNDPPVPLPNCRIIYPALNRATYSDRDGRFIFAAVPPSSKQLRVTGRGQTVTVTVDNETTEQNPFKIHIPLDGNGGN